MVAFLTLILAMLCFVIFPVGVQSEIVIHDMVVPAGKEVMLRAEVKGKLFRKGGVVVEFFVDGKLIGKGLSGGDGIAFKQVAPSATGLHQIKAKSGSDEGIGVLFSLRKGSRIVFIDIEGSLIEKFSGKPKQGSNRAVKIIQNKFPVVFLHTTGFLNLKSIKEWLKKNDFPELPVIQWKQGLAFSDLHDEGFKIKAIIGSPDVIGSAKEYKPLAFSFEETEDAGEVRDWEEIGKKLKEF
jgi:hypothetical protein